MKGQQCDKAAPALKLVASEGPLLIAHRGCCTLAPENTLPSFRLALEAGADLVELDYRHSKDGVPVVIHDRYLDRTTDVRDRWRRKRVRVDRTLAADIESLDAGRWFHAKFAGTQIPLLREALEFIQAKRGVALIEHKAGDAQTCAGLLRSLHLVNHVVVISFDWAFLREFHRLEPAQMLGALGPPTHLADGRRWSGLRRSFGPAWLKKLRKTGARIAVWNSRISGAAVRQAHEAGVKVWVYTVDDLARARRLIRMGADGIITNRISSLAPSLRA